MTATWPFTAAALAAAGYALRGTGRGERNTSAAAAELDVAKAGQLIALAAEWLRAGDLPGTQVLLDMVPEQVWQFARTEVIAVSSEPRIAAFTDRMSAAGFLTTPPASSEHTDRLAQVEVLNLIAQAIRTRMRPAR